MCASPAPSPPTGGSAVIRNTGVLFGHTCDTTIAGAGCNQIDVMLLNSYETDSWPGGSGKGFFQVFELKLKKTSADRFLKSTALISFTSEVDIVGNDIRAQIIVSVEKYVYISRLTVHRFNCVIYNYL